MSKQNITREVLREVREREQRARNCAEVAEHIIAILNNPETPDKIAEALYEAVGDLAVPTGAIIERTYLTRAIEESRD